MEVLVERCAGLDVHKDTVAACIRTPDPQGGRAQEVRTFRTTTVELLALRDWLTACGVTLVGMESTGVYWKPIVRHEAPSDRVGVGEKTPRGGRRSGPLKLGAARTWRRRRGREQLRQRRGGPALPDDPGSASKAGRCTSAETSGQTPSSPEPTPTWWMWVGQQRTSRKRDDSRVGGAGPNRRPRGRTAAYPWRGCRGKAGRLPRQAVSGEHGNHPEPPSPPASQAGGGQASRRLMARRWGGAPVVVRGRESRPHGKGGQRVRSRRAGMPGGRR